MAHMNGHLAEMVFVRLLCSVHPVSLGEGPQAQGVRLRPEGRVVRTHLELLCIGDLSLLHLLI